jgi:hypothetical protein
LAKIGYSVDIIRKFREISREKASQAGKVHDRREFVQTMLRIAVPPYSREFVDEMADCLSEKTVKDLLVPSDRANVSNVFKTSMRGLRQFIEKVEQSSRTEKYSDAAIEKLLNLKAETAGFD